MANNSGRFNGKVVVVTGGAMGMGQATAAAFAREGAMVAIVDVADAAAEAVVAEITNLGGSATYIRADVGNGAGAATAIEATVKAYGGTPGIDCSPCTLALLMITPPPRARMCGMPYLAMRKWLLTFTSMIRSHTASGVFSALQ